MKIEFVEFYPNRKPKKDSQTLGTVHVYLVKEQIDIRGIRVIKKGNRFMFHLPHTVTIDEDGKRVRYPNVNFVDEKKHKALFIFLQDKVRHQILDRLKVPTENRK